MKRKTAGIISIGLGVSVAVFSISPIEAEATNIAFCHKGKTIYFADWDEVAKQDHLSHGDYEGTCQPVETTTTSVVEDTTTTVMENTTTTAVVENTTTTVPVEESTTTVIDDTTTTAVVEDSTTTLEIVETTSGLTVCEVNPTFCEPPPISVLDSSTQQVLPDTGTGSGVLLLVASLFAMVGMGLLIVRRRPI